MRRLSKLAFCLLVFSISEGQNGNFLEKVSWGELSCGVQIAVYPTSESLDDDKSDSIKLLIKNNNSYSCYFADRGLGRGLTFYVNDALGRRKMEGLWDESTPFSAKSVELPPGETSEIRLVYPHYVLDALVGRQVVAKVFIVDRENERVCEAYSGKFELRERTALGSARFPGS